MGEGLNSLYGRQRFKPPRSIALVGCGGGMHIASFAAMAGTRMLKLFDSDVVEISNLNRLPYTPNDVGKKKTTALREYIQRLRPDCEVEEYPAVTDTLQIPLLEADAIVIAIDSLEARKTIDAEVSKVLGKPCLHVNFETDKYKVSWGLWEDEKKSVELGTGYMNPDEQYVTTAVTACALAVAKLMNTSSAARAGNVNLEPKLVEEDNGQKKKPEEKVKA